MMSKFTRSNNLGKPIRSQAAKSVRSIIVVFLFSILTISASSCGLAKSQSTSEAEGPLIPSNTDITQLVIKPDLVKDIFPTSGYSISQSLDQGTVKGFVQTFPTASIQYTMAFSEGYETKVWLYPDIEATKNAFTDLAMQQKGTKVPISQVGNSAACYQSKVLTPEGDEINNAQYVLVLRDRNVLIQATLRVASTKTLSPQRIDQIATDLIKKIPA